MDFNSYYDGSYLSIWIFEGGFKYRLCKFSDWDCMLVIVRNTIIYLSVPVTLLSFVVVVHNKIHVIYPVYHKFIKKHSNILMGCVLVHTKNQIWYGNSYANNILIIKILIYFLE